LYHYIKNNPFSALRNASLLSFVFLLFVREVLSSLFGANPLDFIRLFFLMGPVFVLHLSSRMEWLISAHFCVGHKFWSSLLHIMFAIDFFLLTLTILSCSEY
jgi:hypothetical protein